MFPADSSSKMAMAETVIEYVLRRLKEIGVDEAPPLYKKLHENVKSFYNVR
jgi:hypothetical protein